MHTFGMQTIAVSKLTIHGASDQTNGKSDTPSYSENEVDSR